LFILEVNFNFSNSDGESALHRAWRTLSLESRALV
jgi:hypothetical protein